MIRTVHRFGYAFTGQLEREAGGDSSEPVLGWLITDAWRLPLRSGETVLGREGEGVVPLPSPSVSRQHAALVIEGTAARLRDLGSKNGTFVDETRVERPTALRDGARLRFGTLEVIYRTAERDLVDGNRVTDLALQREALLAGAPRDAVAGAEVDDAPLERGLLQAEAGADDDGAIEHVGVHAHGSPSCTNRRRR